MDEQDRAWRKRDTEPISVEALDAALRLLQFPAEHVLQVTESVEFSWTENTHTIRMVFDPGESYFDRAKKKPGLYVPLYTLRKNALLTIESVSSAAGMARLLPHKEHISLSQALITYAFILTTREWDDPKVVLFDEILPKLHSIVELQPDQAADVFAECFTDGKLVGLEADQRPRFERRLYELCETLSKRYLVVAHLSPRTPLDCDVSWTAREPNWTGDTDSSVGGRLRHLLGDSPQNVRIKAPRARTTNDYHLRMTAPPGHFALQSTVRWTPQFQPSGAYASKQGRRLPKLGTYRDVRTGYATSGGAAPRSHVYVDHGTLTAGRIDVMTVWNEVPLGSLGPPTVAAWFSFTLCALLILSRAFDFAADLPASFVALALGGTLAPTTALLTRDGVRHSLLSRALTLALGLLSLGFAVWWGIPDAGKELGAWDHRLRYRWSGIGIVACLFALATLGTAQLRVAVINYRKLRKKEIADDRYLDIRDSVVKYLRKVKTWLN